MLVKILLVVAIVIAAVFVAALFTKSAYTVQRSVSIKQPKNVVFSYIRLLKNQDSFSKWASIDANMKKEYKGTDGTVGFVSAWDSNQKNVGKGEQEIKKISDGARVDYEIRFIKPFAGVAQAYMSTDSISANETKVVWSFDSKMPYPMNIMLWFMDMEKAIGGDLEIGLNNLKKVLEK